MRNVGSGRNNRDLEVVAYFTKASSNIWCEVANVALPLEYIHSHSGGTIVSRGFTYEAVVGRTRRATALYDTDAANMTIKSVSIRGRAPNVVLNDGQEFVKDNLHKLLIAYWEVTWGP